MTVKWQKIYRGGVQRTTPETREAPAPTTGTVQPGTVVTLSAAGAIVIGAVAQADAFVYFVDNPLFGSVDDNVAAANANGTRDTVRLCIPHSGDLLVGRAAAGVALRDDLPLKVNASGLLEAATLGTDVVVCYVDQPASAIYPVPVNVTPTVVGQLIPVKIK